MVQPTMSQEIDELAAALVAAQGEFSVISKDSTNPFFKSKYAGLPEVMKTTGPVLVKHDLAVLQFISCSPENEGQDLLTTWLIHSSGQYINDTMHLKLSKQDAQGQGSAITYARRYAYMAMLGLVAEEDDDGNAASKSPAGQPAKPMYASKKPIENGLITQDQYGDLLNRVKAKGIADKPDAIGALNALALNNFDAPTEGLTQTQAAELSLSLNSYTLGQLRQLLDEPFL